MLITEEIKSCPVCKSGMIVTNKKDEVFCRACGYALTGQENLYEKLVAKWNKLGTLNIKSKSQARRLSAQL